MITYHITQDITIFVEGTENTAEVFFLLFYGILV